MRTIRIFRLFVFLSIAFTVGLVAAYGQSSDREWHKTYSLTGEPFLVMETADTGVEIRSCGDCRQVQIDLQMNDRKLSDYSLTEFQSGNGITFKLKEKPHVGMHIGFHVSKGPHLVVKTPAKLHLEARTADGSLSASGLQGEVSLHTSDGSVDVSDVAGTLHFVSSDGSIRIHNASGTLDARSSDGHLTVEGRFSALQVHTSDGNLDLALAEGSQLTAASRVETSDGQVSVRLPRSLAADLDIHSSDGHIDCSLPLTMDGYHSHGSSSHDIRGKLNAGGNLLSIRTSDGNIKVSSL